MLHEKFKLIITFLLSFGLTGLQAQEVIPSTGGNASGSGGTATYTVGQVIYTTNTGTNGSVAQGVQQPYEISIVNGIEEGEGINLSYSVYPNPTADFLTLKIVGEVKVQYMASLYNVSGKLLKTQKVEGNETSINMNNCTPAIYFLKITNNNKEVKTFKIIKN